MKITMKGKRIVALLLTIVLLVSVLPSGVSFVSSHETEQQGSYPEIGKLAKVVSFSFGSAYSNPTNLTSYLIVASSYYPKRVVITDVRVVNGTTYYQLSAAENYEWPSFGPGDGYWLESSKVELVEVCDKCGAEECQKVHVFCPYCAKYDCTLEHNDPYQPYVAPMIPTNPTMTPGADVSLADEYGNAVTSSIVLNEGKKFSLSAWPNLSGKVTYQWQVCYSNAKQLWVDISGQNEKGILLSYTMFRSLVDAQGLTYVRCVTTNGTDTMTSQAIPVILDVAAQTNSAVRTASAMRYTNNRARSAAPTSDEVKYAVTIKYVVKETGAEPPEASWVVHLAPGANYVLDVAPPPMVGYYTGDAAGNPIERITETIVDIQAPRDFTVYYWPDFVDFKVNHYQQRVGEDKYDLVATDIVENLRTGQMVGSALAKNYTGFDPLPYDTTITVAADGSTEVNIYYDRQYFMIAIDLNGGYGAEPVYARYETPISIPDPKRTGYVFDGWVNLKSGQKESIVATMPVIPEADNYRITYQAQWDVANTKFVVAFWYENANDTDYAFVGSVQLEGKTGNTISGTSYAYLNYLDSSTHFDGFEADYAKHFENLNESKTNKNVTIKADGSTVVNVYFYRNVYTLTYYEFVCQHQTHSDSCYSITLNCNKSVHTKHEKSCQSNLGNKVTSNNNISELNANTPNATDGTRGYFQVTFLGAVLDTYYCVYWGGTWYHLSGTDENIKWNNCPGIHSHEDSCYTKKLVCDHATAKSYFNCACIGTSAQTTQANWKIAKKTNGELGQATFKYGQKLDGFHAAMGSYRWCPGVCDGYPYITESGNYGKSGAVGMVLTMPQGDAAFYRKSDGPYDYTVRYWLESPEEGNNSFIYTETFTPSMGALDYDIDYIDGIPAGFKSYQQWACDKDWVEKTQMFSGDSFGSEYLNFNFYYQRQRYPLVYKNHGDTVASVEMKFEQPLTSSYDLSGANLISPYGPGYYFAGWYLDDACSIEAKFDGSEKMPQGGMALHAKWEPINHSVKTYLTKEEIGKTPINSYGIHHGDTFTNTYPGQTVAIPKHPDGLTFIGWFYEEDGKEVAYDFSMPVYRDMNLYAKWSSNVMTKATIYYVDTNGNKLAKPLEVIGLVGDTKTYTAKFSSELGDGTRLYFPDVTSHSIKFAANPDQNVFTFTYTELPEVGYTIHFVDKDTGVKLFDSVTGTAKTATVTYDAQAAGKIKDKYYLDKNSKEFALSSDREHNEFYFYYTYDPGKATVQVMHYIQNLNGTGYDFHSESPSTVEELETIIKAADRKVTINGFTYSYAEFNGKVATEQTLTGGLTIKLYYTRNSYNYTFRFVYTKGGAELEFPNSRITGTAKYRANIEQIAKEFPGYQPDSGAKSIIVDYREENNTYTFYYTEKSIDIRYSVGAVKGGSISSTGEPVYAITGTPVGSTATVNSNGKYTFTGWYTDYNCTQLESTELHFAPKQTDGIYVSKTYYAGFKEAKATISYEVEMPTGAAVNATLLPGSEQVDMVTGIAGGSKVETIPTGYAFDGWYDANGNLLSKDSSFKPNRPVDGWAATQTFYARFVKLHTITWNYGYEIDPDTTELVHGTEVKRPADPVRKNYTFLGWYTDAECTTKYVFGQKLTEDITLYAKWELKTTTLKIDVTNWAQIDEAQSFLFSVKSEEDDENVDLEVNVRKDGFVIIEGLKIGSAYTITLQDWAWRYQIGSAQYPEGATVNAGDTSVTITLVAAETLVLNMERVNDYWLDGNDYMP